MEVIGSNKVIIYNTNYYMHINMANLFLKNTIVVFIIAISLFLFLKMYIQNAAQ